MRDAPRSGAWAYEISWCVHPYWAWGAVPHWSPMPVTGSVTGPRSSSMDLDTSLDLLVDASFDGAVCALVRHHLRRAVSRAPARFLAIGSCRAAAGGHDTCV